MRLDELILRVPGDEFRVRFHPQLTVLAGIGLLERQALADNIVEAMIGTAGNATLHYTDVTGNPVLGIAPAISLRVDANAMQSLVLVQASDLGIEPTEMRTDESPELQEARATLADLTKELQAAVDGHEQHEHLTAELELVERDIRHAEDSTARREYAKVLAELERVRAEAAVLQGGQEGAENDRELLASASDARELANRWRDAVKRVAALHSRLMSDTSIDPATVAAAQHFPDEVPRDLRRLMTHVDVTRAERDAIEAKLKEHAASTLPAPSDPHVVDLATADQTIVWAARDRVVRAAQSLESEKLALGGTGSKDRSGHSETVERLEEAHSSVVAAEKSLEARRTRTLALALALGVIGFGAAGIISPMVGLGLIAIGLVVGLAGVGGPAGRVAAAKRAERVVLEEVGAASYLAFHLRRVDASVVRGAHERLEAAAREHRAALQGWSSLMPNVTVEQALVLEAEARAYARSLSELGDKAGQIENLRRALVDQAEPAYEEARAALATALDEFQLGVLVDAPAEEIEEAVEGQVEIGCHARAQVELDDADATSEKLSNRLDDLLNHLGFRDGSLEARAGALEWAVDRAGEREQARAQARSQAEIERDLERLQAEARRLRRPEWAEVQASEAALPDADELRRRRDEIAAKLAAGRRSELDLEKLSDRHSAMERRVAALEAKHDGGRAAAVIAQIADVQERLAACLTAARHVGPMDEPVPVIFDDPFVRVPAERKWELLDMLRRLAEHVQIIYLTDDPFVGAWARRRASAGSITLLEPVDA